MGRTSNKDREIRQKFNDYQPDKDLERFCYCLVTNQVRGNKDLAMTLTHVDKGKFYYAIRTNPLFCMWYLKLCMSILINNAEIPPYALLGAIMDKDVAALRLYYELTGQNKGEDKSSEHKTFIQIVTYGNTNNPSASGGIQQPNPQVAIMDKDVAALRLYYELTGQNKGEDKGSEHKTFIQIITYGNTNNPSASGGIQQPNPQVAIRDFKEV